MNPKVAFCAGLIGLVGLVSSGAMAQSLSKRGELPGFGHPIQSLGFSDDGEWLAAGDGNFSTNVSVGTFRVWDLQKQEVVVLFQSRGPVKSVAFGPMRQVALFAGTQDIRSIDLRPHKLLGAYDSGQGDFSSAVLTPDARHVIAPSTGLARSAVYVWGLEDRQVVQAISGRYTQVAINPDGTRLVLGGEDGRVTVLEQADGQWQEKHVLGEAAERDPVSVLAISRDGAKAFAFSSRGGAVYDVAAGSKLSQLEIEPRSLYQDVFSAVFLEDGTLTTGGLDIRFWDPATGQLKGSPVAAHSRGVLSMALSPDGKVLATGGNFDQQILLWDVR